jgi:hypothetical protein
MDISPFWATIFLVPFFLGVCAMLGCALRIAYLSRRAGSWPFVEGMITHAELVRYYSQHDEMYRVYVRYSYTVNGMVYEGNRLAFGYDGCQVRENHEPFERKLKSGTMVDVRYNHVNPQQSCLTFGLTIGIQAAFIWCGTALSFLCGFVLLIWLPPDPELGFRNLLSWTNLPFVVFLVGGVMFCALTLRRGWIPSMVDHLQVR